jgi:RHS repeat-associated protein
VNTSGKERDAETGLDYFGARYFSGAQGRFTSPDPKMFPHDITDPQSWNKYAYTYNNPLRYTDPDGRSPQDDTAAGRNFERDMQAYIAGRMSKQELQSRQAARAAGAAAGASIAFGSEIGALARGLWYSITGYFMTPSGQETAASVAEGLSNAPPGSLTGNLARLSAAEISTGERFAAQEGLQLKVGAHVGEEFVDSAGKTYDAMGQPNAYKFWNPKQFFSSIMDHVNKSNDYTIIDLKGASADQIKQIQTYVGTLTKEQQGTIRYVQ